MHSNYIYVISRWCWNKDGKFNKLSNDIYFYNIIFDNERWYINIKKPLVYALIITLKPPISALGALW